MTDIAPTPVTRIRPSRGWSAIGIGDLWEYRELLYFLIWREIKGRYRQMALGPVWILLIPLVQMTIFAVVSHFAGIGSDELPRTVFIYSALLPWQLFAEATRKSTTSLVSNLGVISKVYFPRLLVPLAAACAGVVDFAVAFFVLIVLMLVYGLTPTVAVLTLPLFVLLAVGAALAIGLWLAALAVKFRDVGYGVNYVVQALFFLCPVFYSAKIIPERYRWVYRLNPMTNVIEGFRWALFGRGIAPDMMAWISVALVAAFLVSGAYVFRRTERTVVDYI